MAQLCVRFHMAYAEHSDTDLGVLYLSGQVSLDTMSTSPSAPVGGTSPRTQARASQSPMRATQDDSKLRKRSSSTRDVAEPADEDAGNSSLKRPAATVASDDEEGADDAEDKPPRKKTAGPNDDIADEDGEIDDEDKPPRNKPAAAAEDGEDEDGEIDDEDTPTRKTPAGVVTKHPKSKAAQKGKGKAKAKSKGQGKCVDKTQKKKVKQSAIT